jgi:hypothetical protein
MSKYLDYTVMPAFLEEHYTGEHTIGYFDIVRFFGADAADPSAVHLKTRSEPFSLADEKIQRFAGEMEAQMRSEGRLYDGPRIVNVCGARLKGDEPCVEIQPCDYGAQAGSCFALDYVHPLFRDEGGTLRRYYRQRYPTSRLEKHPLPQCLGVCGLLRVRERSRQWLLAVKRAARLASLESSLGPSAAGSVDWTEPAAATLGGLIEAAMIAEVTEELSLKSSDFSLRPLAWAREIFRGEKPQVFFLIDTPQGRGRIESLLESNRSQRREFDSWIFVPVDKAGRLLDNSLHKKLNHEAQMNLNLAEEYLRP